MEILGLQNIPKGKIHWMGLILHWTLKKQVSVNLKAIQYLREKRVKVKKNKN